jgi:hypothetical protein
MSDELPQGNRKNCGCQQFLTFIYLSIVFFALIWAIDANFEVWKTTFDDLDIQALL